MRKISVYSVETNKTYTLHDTLESAGRELLSCNSLGVAARINDTGDIIMIPKALLENDYSTLENDYSTDNPVCWLELQGRFKDHDTIISEGIALGNALLLPFLRLASSFDDLKTRGGYGGVYSGLGVRDYIYEHFDGSQVAFAEHQGVKPQQVTQWINKKFIVVNDILYSPRRNLKEGREI